MSENEFLECFKCGLEVDQILALQCDHNLCLLCASKAVSKWPSYSSQPPLICEICASQTQLDPAAVQVLLDLSHNYSDYSVHESQTNRSSVVNTPVPNTTCSQHLTENTNLYCFTCESTCFCMECYLQGMHKNHEVRNIIKSFDIVCEQGNQLSTLMKGSQEQLLHEQCRLTNKKQDLIELVSQAKMRISEQFHDLIHSLKIKEQELLHSADSLVSDQLTAIDSQVLKVKNSMEKVLGYQEQLLRYYDDQRSINQVEATNYLAREKKKMLSLIESIKMEKPQPLTYNNFTLDTQSIQHMVNDIRSIKVSVGALQGNEEQQQTPYLGQQILQPQRTQSQYLKEYIDEMPSKENIQSFSFIERSSQKKSNSSQSNLFTNKDFYNKFHEAKRQILQQKVTSYI